MSREVLRGQVPDGTWRGTSEAVLGLAETYEEYLVQRAQRLTGENSATPASLGDIAINLLVAGTLAPTPHFMDWGQETTPASIDSLEMFGEGSARRAELILNAADSFEGTKKQPSNIRR